MMTFKEMLIKDIEAEYAKKIQSIKYGYCYSIKSELYARVLNELKDLEADYNKTMAMINEKFDEES